MQKQVRLMAAGDIWLQTGRNRHPFREVRHLLQDKDLLFGNLETALSETGERAQKHHVIASPPEAARYLVDAGFDLLSVANNHSVDLGAEGLNNTLRTLESRGILPIGASASPNRQEPIILEKNGIAIGFAGYTTGRTVFSGGASVNRLIEEDIVADIASLAGKCDHIAVSLHWGTEMAYYPSPGQIDLAHRLIDAGATLILGHHSHTMQAIERYHSGLIAYSLGMFQFDPNWPHNLSQEAFILSVDLQEGGVVGKHEVIPLTVDDDFVPRPAEEVRSEEIRAFITEISKPVAGGGITWARWFEEIAPAYMTMNLESYRYRIRERGLLPLLEMGVWLCTPFCLKCYGGLIRRSLRPLSVQERRAPRKDAGN
ncbi:CapA family protein [Methanoculleus sp. UBA303]|uniref:CapA family protein n=1 Tax=Methanoculleus sp. UBA303 TaxID=1915497 RepID=UPI0025D8E768|nr:CapA family protein [Methanoculleus sp. UBA303]